MACTLERVRAWPTYAYVSGWPVQVIIIQIGHNFTDPGDGTLGWHGREI